MNHLSPSLKLNAIDFSCSVVVHKIEKSKHGIDIALSRLLRLLIEIITC